MSKRKSFAKTLSERADEALARDAQEDAEPQKTGAGEQEASKASDDTLEALPARPTPPPQAQTGEFKKFTVPIRTDQLDELTKTVARLTLDFDVNVSKAVLIRYGLAQILTQIGADPDAFLQGLYAFEEEEIALNADRKYSASQGLKQYVDKASQQ